MVVSVIMDKFLQQFRCIVSGTAQDLERAGWFLNLQVLMNAEGIPRRAFSPRTKLRGHMTKIYGMFPDFIMGTSFLI